MSSTYGRLEGLQLACHDIRQPIAGVLALAGAALTETGLPESARMRLNQIIGLAEWQSDVIEHWLYGPGCGPADSRHTDVVWVVNEAAAAERVTWAGELTLVWPPESVFVSLHSVTVRRMAANLLANATRAAGPSGTVTIEVSSHARRMLLAVEDDGPGFGRLPAGLGLGLSEVAREAVEHHGRLECGRSSLGGGRVNLWLPLMAPDGVADVRDDGQDATCPV
jgi:C4-dicarboxylate-specific signal transduction histidine kinase